MAKLKPIVNEACEDAPSDVPTTQIEQSATWGFPKPSKKGDNGVSSATTQNGAGMDRVERGKDWPEPEELESLGFED